MITQEKKRWQDLTNREKADFVTRFNEGQRGGAALSTEGEPRQLRERLDRLSPYTLDLCPVGREIYLVVVPDRNPEDSWIAPPDIQIVRDDYRGAENPITDEHLATYIARSLRTDMRLDTGTTSIEATASNSQLITVEIAGAGRFRITVEQIG